MRREKRRLSSSLAKAVLETHNIALLLLRLFLHTVAVFDTGSSNCHSPEFTGFDMSMEWWGRAKIWRVRFLG